MPPFLALVLCIILVLCLYIDDIRRQPRSSKAIWIPLIWLLMFGSRYISRWLNTGASFESSGEYLEGSLLDRSILGVLIAAGLFILYRRRIPCGRIFQNNKWVVIYFIYCGISIIWSDYTSVSGKSWIKGLGTLVMVLVVITDRNPIAAVKTLMRRWAYALIPLSVILIRYFPGLGVRYDGWTGKAFYVGAGDDKNMLGYVCLLCGLFFVWNLLTIWRRKAIRINKKEISLDLFFLVMVCWVLSKAQSATSIGAFIAGTCILVMTGLPFIRRSAKHLGLYIIVVAAIALIGFALLDVRGFILSALNRDETLTGRTELWKIILTFDTNPLIGVGYDGFFITDGSFLGSREERVWKEFGMRVNEAHNGYLEVYLNLGALGLFFLIGIIIKAYRNSLKALLAEYDFGRFRIAILGVVLLYSITEACFRGQHPMWCLFLIVAMAPTCRNSEVLKRRNVAEDFPYRYR